VCPLRTRERHGCVGSGGWESRLYLGLQALAVQVQAGPPMQPPAPITPEQRSRPHRQRMQQHADLARLRYSAALPLTLFAQRTGAATADAGSIDHAQASIGLSTLLMGTKLLMSGAAERPIWLEREIVVREATSFRCGPHLRRSIAGRRSYVR